jgi:ubiquinone/menaquinone biosynthesis C-methylase UbiE
LLLRRFSGQKPARLVVTDQSGELLELAQHHFSVPEAEYKLLDVRSAFQFPDNTFDLILATMVFNEVSPAGLRKALEECYRVLKENGQLLVTVTHPAFVESLAKRSQLKRLPDGFLTMPGADGLRLPVIPHRVEHYESVMQKAGFQFEKEAVFATSEVLHARPGLREAGNIPIALIVDCRKVSI